MKDIVKKIVVLILFLGVFMGGFQTRRVIAQESESSPSSEDRLLNEIKERGVLRMGTASGYAPFEFTVVENGENKLVGADIRLGEQIAEDIGVELEVVDMDFGNLITSMETGNIDMVIAGMSYTKERDESIDFSNVYFVDEQAFAIRPEDEDQITGYQSFIDNNLAIGVQENTLQQTIVQEEMPDDIEMVTMRKTGDLVATLQAGQIDGILLNQTVANAYAAENQDIMVVPSQFDREADGVAVGLPENQPSFLSAVNTTVDTVVETNQFDVWLEESYDLIRSQQESSWLAYWPYFWDGIKTTLLISAVSIVVGAILGAILALMRLSGNPILDTIAKLYIEIVRGTPLMIQVLFIYLGLGSIFNWSTLVSGLVSVSLNSGAYIAEIIRGGINSVDKGQSEAAQALGLDRRTTMRQVIFPQSLRSIWPSLGNEFVTLIKESSIVSTIGVAELTFQTRSVTNLTYQGIEPLVISMALYLFLTYSLTKVLNWYENKMEAQYVK